MKVLDILARVMRAQYKAAEAVHRQMGTPESRTALLVMERISNAFLEAASEVGQEAPPRPPTWRCGTATLITVYHSDDFWIVFHTPREGQDPAVLQRQAHGFKNYRPRVIV